MFFSDNYCVKRSNKNVRNTYKDYTDSNVKKKYISKYGAQQKHLWLYCENKCGCSTQALANGHV